MMTAPPTIVVVDDDAEHRYCTRLLLEDAGFAVEEAGNGQDALLAATGKPDLIVLDMRLPDIAGDDVCRRLKETPGTAAIPVLTVTASYPGADERRAALAAGVDGHLTRPVDPELLLATVRKLLRVG